MNNNVDVDELADMMMLNPGVKGADLIKNLRLEANDARREIFQAFFFANFMPRGWKQFTDDEGDHYIVLQCDVCDDDLSTIPLEEAMFQEKILTGPDFVKGKLEIHKPYCK